ncbi:MAG: acyltransferase family protein [Agriterribacter sp.]
MKDRLSYIDQLKGIAIFLVVFGHSIQNNTVESDKQPLFVWLYSFHMPLFMFISGYIAGKSTHINSLSDYGIFLKKRVISLLIPYFVWPLLVHNFFFKKNDTLDFATQGWKLITQWNSLWYLWFLFFLLICYSLFYIASRKLNKKNIILIDVIIASSIAALLYVIKPLGLFISSSSFLLYFLFLFSGVFAYKYSIISNVLLNQWIFSISLLLFIVLSGRYDYNDNGNLNKLLKIIIAFSAISSLYYIVRKIKWNPTVDKYVQLLGRNTIVIYTTHFAINWFFKGVPLFSNLGLVSLILVNFVLALIVIIACLLIFEIVQLSPLLNFLLYGHMPKASRKPVPDHN